MQLAAEQTVGAIPQPFGSRSDELAGAILPRRAERAVVDLRPAIAMWVSVGLNMLASVVRESRFEKDRAACWAYMMAGYMFPWAIRHMNYPLEAD